MDWQLFLQELNRIDQQNARPMASVYLPSNTYCFFFNNNPHDFKHGISDRITLAHPVERMGLSGCNLGGIGEFGHYNANGSIIDTGNVTSPEINFVIEPSQDCLIDETQTPSTSNTRKRRKTSERSQQRNKKQRRKRTPNPSNGSSSSSSLSEEDTNNEDDDDDDNDDDGNNSNKYDNDDDNDTNNDANASNNRLNYSVLPAVDLDKINAYHDTLEEINRPYSLIPPHLQKQQQSSPQQQLPSQQQQSSQQQQQTKRQRQRRKKRSSERSSAQTPTSGIINLLPSQSNPTSAVESDSYSLLPRPYFNKPLTSFYRTTFASDSEFDVDGLRLELENPSETINSMKTESYI